MSELLTFKDETSEESDYILKVYFPLHFIKPALGINSASLPAYINTSSECLQVQIQSSAFHLKTTKGTEANVKSRKT